MRTLILGAGATGGYFGGRLLETGADVTFLVRPQRAEKLKRNGLAVTSQFGDMKLGDLRLATTPAKHYELIVLSCKGYDLDSAMDSIEPAVGKGSTIMPLLNGLQHLDRISRRFGPAVLIGGLCIISSFLDEEGVIRHLNDHHVLKFGELSGEMSSRVKSIEALFDPAKCASQPSEHIQTDMWEKWVMIASMAAITTLMRANIGEVARSPGGKSIAEQLLQECVATMKANESEPRQKFVNTMNDRLIDPRSTLTASMLRDVEGGKNVESDHILGDLIERAESKGINVPLLRIAYCHAKSYEERRRSNRL